MTTQYPTPARAEDKRVYTVAEAAALLDVSRNTMYKLVRENQFSSRKVGTDIRISKASFDSWLESR